MPSMVTLLRRGSVPRIWMYLPSPSSRSSETLGSRPTGDVGVRQAGDGFRGQNLNDVVGGALHVKGFDLTALPASLNCYGFVLSADMESYIRVRDLARINHDARGGGAESNLGNRYGVCTRRQISDRELPLAVGRDRPRGGLYHNASSGQEALAFVLHATRDVSILSLSVRSHQ